MSAAGLSTLLDRLIAGWESEVVEFKEANREFGTDKIGRYFSASSMAIPWITLLVLELPAPTAIPSL